MILILEGILFYDFRPFYSDTNGENSDGNGEFYGGNGENSDGDG